MRNSRIFLVFATLASMAGLLLIVKVAYQATQHPISDQIALARKGDGKALKALTDEANAGSADAQVALGDFYASGNGIPVDYPKAAIWLRKAAAQENAEAEFDLGTIYASGLGVPVDYVKACALMNLAVMQDKKYEKYRLNLVTKEMTSKQYAAAQELSRKMLRVGVLKALDAR